MRRIHLVPPRLLGSPTHRRSTYGSRPRLVWRWCRGKRLGRVLRGLLRNEVHGERIGIAQILVIGLRVGVPKLAGH